MESLLMVGSPIIKRRNNNMSIFNRNNNKETISLYKNECKRLEEERNRLLDELNAIQGYKEEYENLIEEVTNLKIRYNTLISKTEAIGNEYKKKLDNIIKTDY